MTTTPATSPSDASAPWTCPFCSLLCDRHTIAAAPALPGGLDCPKALQGLAAVPAPGGPVSARIDGVDVTLDTALAKAAAVLAASRQPLFGGLATDVAGNRALYRLANDCGAILDHAHGEALTQSLRALQDKGVFYTTLAEIRNHADLMVCVGVQPGAHYPKFFERCGFAATRPTETALHVAFLASAVDPSLPAGVSSREALCTDGGSDLFDLLSQLNALVTGRRVPGAHADLAALAERLLAARYAVLVYEPGALPAQAALLIESINRVVSTLNRKTRAATFSLGGSDGGYSAQQVVSWMSGFPLRSAPLRQGLQHEPVRFASRRLIEDKAVDALLWVGSFPAAGTPPAFDGPRVVLGHPGLTLGDEAGSVFIPVATPGVNSAGHLFRLDGGVVLPLHALRDDGLATVASVVGQIADRLKQTEGAAQ